MSRRISQVSLRDLLSTNPGDLVCSSNNSFNNDSGIFESSQVSQMSQSRTDWSDCSQLSQVYMSKGPVYNAHALPKGPMSVPKATSSLAGSQGQISMVSQPQIELYKAKASELERRDLLTGVIASVKELATDMKMLKETVQLDMSSIETLLKKMCLTIGEKMDKNNDDVGALLSAHNDSVTQKFNHVQHSMSNCDVDVMETTISRRFSKFESLVSSEIQQSVAKQSDFVRSCTNELISCLQREVGKLSSATERQIIDVMHQTKSDINRLEQEIIEGLRHRLKVNRSSADVTWNVDNDMITNVRHQLTLPLEEQQTQIENVVHIQSGLQRQTQDLAVENQKQLTEVLMQLRDYLSPTNSIKNTQKLNGLVQNILDEKMESYVQSMSNIFVDKGNVEATRAAQNAHLRGGDDTSTETECPTDQLSAYNCRQYLLSAGCRCDKNVAIAGPSRSIDENSATLLANPSNNATVPYCETSLRQINSSASSRKRSCTTESEVVNYLNSAVSANSEPRGAAKIQRESCSLLQHLGMNAPSDNDSNAVPHFEADHVSKECVNIGSILQRNAAAATTCTVTRSAPTESGTLPNVLASTSRIHEKGSDFELMLNTCHSPSFRSYNRATSLRTSSGCPLFSRSPASIIGATRYAQTSFQSTPNLGAAPAPALLQCTNLNASFKPGQLQPLSKCVVGPSPIATVLPQVQVSAVTTDNVTVSYGIVQQGDVATFNPASDISVDEPCTKNTVISKRKKRRKKVYSNRRKSQKKLCNAEKESLVQITNSGSQLVRNIVGEFKKMSSSSFVSNDAGTGTASGGVESWRVKKAVSKQVSSDTRAPVSSAKISKASYAKSHNYHSTTSPTAGATSSACDMSIFDFSGDYDELEIAPSSVKFGRNLNLSNIKVFSSTSSRNNHSSTKQSMKTIRSQRIYAKNETRKDTAEQLYRNGSKHSNLSKFQNHSYSPEDFDSHSSGSSSPSVSISDLVSLSWR